LALPPRRAHRRSRRAVATVGGDHGENLKSGDALAFVASLQQSESTAPLDTREPARVTTDVQRSVSRDQRTNRTVLTLKKCSVIERATQRIVESAIPVTIDSRRIRAASQQQFNDGCIAVTGGHHQRRDI